MQRLVFAARLASAYGLANLVAGIAWTVVVAAVVGRGAQDIGWGLLALAPAVAVVAGVLGFFQRGGLLTAVAERVLDDTDPGRVAEPVPGPGEFGRIAPGVLVRTALVVALVLGVCLIWQQTSGGFFDAGDDAGWGVGPVLAGFGLLDCWRGRRQARRERRTGVAAMVPEPPLWRRRKLRPETVERRIVPGGPAP